ASVILDTSTGTPETLTSWHRIAPESSSAQPAAKSPMYVWTPDENPGTGCGTSAPMYGFRAWPQHDTAPAELTAQLLHFVASTDPATSVDAASAKAACTENAVGNQPHTNITTSTDTQRFRMATPPLLDWSRRAPRRLPRPAGRSLGRRHRATRAA